jgi:hypothetical protein
MDTAGFMRWLTLDFVPGRAAYVPDHNAIRFFALARRGAAGIQGIGCWIGREVLEACFGPGPLDAESCLAVFRQHRATIEAAIQRKYPSQPRTEQVDLTPICSDIVPDRSRGCDCDSMTDVACEHPTRHQPHNE